MKKLLVLLFALVSIGASAQKFTVKSSKMEDVKFVNNKMKYVNPIEKNINIDFDIEGEEVIVNYPIAYKYIIRKISPIQYENISGEITESYTITGMSNYGDPATIHIYKCKFFTYVTIFEGDKVIKFTEFGETFKK